MTSLSAILGVVLAGGKASRLQGQNKALIKAGNNSCFDRVIERFKPSQLHQICVSYPESQAVSSRISGRYEHIYDRPSQQRSTGAAWAIYSSLLWAQERGFDAVITSPVDMPFLPQTYIQDLVDQYLEHPQSSVVCSTQGRIHGLNALWPLDRLHALKDLIEGQSVHKLQDIHKMLGSVQLEYNCGKYDPFYNINTQVDIELANELALTLQI